MMLLIDSRRGIGPGDKEMMKLMDDAAVSWAVVLTKMDKLKQSEKAALISKTEAGISRHVAAYPKVWATSSETGDGIPALRAHIVSLAIPT
jgi:GTP-binding protein